MVYFWQRQSRPTSASPGTSTITPSSHSTATQASSLSSFSLGAAQTTRLQKSRSSNYSAGSNGNGNIGVGGSGVGTGHATPTTNYSLNKSHHIPSNYSLDKLSEYSRRKQESDRRRVAERELDSLNSKIDKLLSKMGETEADNQARLRLEEECVVCLAAAATMQTFPCGHKVVCRKCLIKTIQVAVSQRCLPLRCVICRDRILRLHQTMHYHGSSGSSTPISPSSIGSALLQTGRFASSPITPTSPTSLFTLINGSKSQSSSPRLLSPTGSGIQSLHSPTPSTSSDNVPKLTHLTQGTLEDEFSRYTPSDFEAFVSSHNDALNLHATESHRPATAHDIRSVTKVSSHSSVPNVRRNDASSHGFMHSQSVKIHPQSSNQPCSFMDSPNGSNTVPSAHSQTNPSQKPLSASRFLARFLPKSSRRRCNWFRHD